MPEDRPQVNEKSECASLRVGLVVAGIKERGSIGGQHGGAKSRIPNHHVVHPIIGAGLSCVAESPERVIAWGSVEAAGAGAVEVGETSVRRVGRLSVDVLVGTDCGVEGIEMETAGVPVHFEVVGKI